MCSTGGEQHVWCSCWSTSYKRGAAYESWILRWPLQADVSHTCAARSAERACSLAECTTLFNMLQACLYTWPQIKQCTSTECYIRKTNKKGHFWAPVGLGVQISYTSRQGHINGCTTNQTVQTNSPEHLVKKKSRTETLPQVLHQTALRCTHVTTASAVPLGNSSKTAEVH